MLTSLAGNLCAAYHRVVQALGQRGGRIDDTSGTSRVKRRLLCIRGPFKVNLLLAQNAADLYLKYLCLHPFDYSPPSNLHIVADPNVG